MPSVTVLILRAPGTNCDRETAFAFERAGALAKFVHINRLLENPGQLSEFQILCFPGGFSYGDDIAAGRILACQIKNHLAEVLHEFREAGNLILGICNGFQVLIKSGILLDDTAATLTWNDSGKFEDRWVHLKSVRNSNVFLNGVDKFYLPIAHAEGKFVVRDTDTLGTLDQNCQLVLRYADSEGDCDGVVEYPQNPNGSIANVAGVSDESGRILGMMPHPERYIDPTHHPQWTRRENQAEGDGLQLFRNAVHYFE